MPARGATTSLRFAAAGGDCDPHAVTVSSGETTLHIACLLADGSAGAIEILSANYGKNCNTVCDCVKSHCMPCCTNGPPCCTTCIGKGNDYDKIGTACDKKQSCVYTSALPARRPFR